MQYLVTGEFIDPAPLLPPEQLVGALRQAVLPSHDALTGKQHLTQRSLIWVMRWTPSRMILPS